MFTIGFGTDVVVVPEPHAKAAAEKNDFHLALTGVIETG